MKRGTNRQVYCIVQANAGRSRQVGEIGAPVGGVLLTCRKLPAAGIGHSVVHNSSPIPILTYHQVDRPPVKGAPFRSLTVDPVRFAGQMRWLRRLGYRGLSMRDLQPYLVGERVGKVFGLTFDDGFRNVHRHVPALLDELGFTATNYFVAGHPDGANFWDARHGVTAAPLMSVAEIREWAQAGHEVGSHTVDHANLTEVDEATAREQIRRSREILEDLVQQPVQAFCYPYGHYSPVHAGLVREAGYTSATTTRRGRARAGGDMWQLPRVPIVRSTHLLSLLQKLFTSYEDRRGNR